MKTYRLNDGIVLSANTPTQLLRALWHKSRTAPSTFEEFRKQLRTRIEDQMELPVASTTPDELVQAMLITGLVEEIEPTGEIK